jgi:hypothetical protein
MVEDKKDPKEIAAEIIEQGKTDQAVKRVKVARYILLAIAILTLVQNLIVSGDTTFGDDFYFNLIDVVLFILLFVLSFKHPRIIFIIGLLFYVVPHIYLAVLHSESIINGIFLKLVIVVGLVQGILTTSKLPKAKIIEDDELLDDF